MAGIASFLREDGKWIQQYDSLFIVMNGEGQIVTWQVTKGTTFSQGWNLTKGPEGVIKFDTNSVHSRLL